MEGGSDRTEDCDGVEVAEMGWWVERCKREECDRKDGGMRIVGRGEEKEVVGSIVS